MPLLCWNHQLHHIQETICKHDASEAEPGPLYVWLYVNFGLKTKGKCHTSLISCKLVSMRGVETDINNSKYLQEYLPAIYKIVTVISFLILSHCQNKDGVRLYASVCNYNGNMLIQGQ